MFYFSFILKPKKDRTPSPYDYGQEMQSFFNLLLNYACKGKLEGRSPWFFRARPE